MRMCHFQAQNGPFILNKIFLVQTIIITFIYLLVLFIVQHLKKIFTADLELWGCAIFGAKMVHLPQFFFGKKINIIFIYLLAPFIVQNFKNFLHRIQSYEDVPFWDPKWSTCPNENFFRKHVNRPCSFHSCVSECKKSKSDINLLMKY